MVFDVIVVLVAAFALGWWWSARRKAASATAGEDDPSAPHDSAQAYEKAKAQAELQRWSGPH